MEILKDEHVGWRPLEHRLLIGGILLIILSFGTDLFMVKLNQPADGEPQTVSGPWEKS